MPHRIRSTRLKAVLLALVIAPAAQCGDNSKVVQVNLHCVVEGFQGGSFLFSVDGIDDRCLDGRLNDLFPGGTYGPLDLPGFEEVPVTVEIPFGPPIGTVTVSITAGKDAFLVTMTDPPDIEIEVPAIGTLHATISGSICPILAPDQIVATSRIRINPLPPLISQPCDVIVTATGRPSEQG